jgi:hypothetical protein
VKKSFKVVVQVKRLIIAGSEKIKTAISSLDGKIADADDSFFFFNKLIV